MTRRFVEWPYWLPVLRNARTWLVAGAAALGFTRRYPRGH